MKITKNISITIPYFLSGCCLQCYQCLSARGWDDCHSRIKKQNCRLGQVTCTKSEHELEVFGGTVYAKGCVNNDAWCEGFKKNYCVEDKCKIYCCDGNDLCNAATVPMASVVILLACLLVALHRYVGL